MPGRRDYYQLLGVPQNANPDQIKKAYRDLALKHHPDRNPGDTSSEERFKEINQAYQVLGDPEKRAQYDRFGDRAPFTYSDDAGFPTIDDLFSGLFDEVFGRRTRGRGPVRSRGSDYRYDLKISLEEAEAGAGKTITVEKPQTCPVCNGAGLKPGTSPTICPDCRGKGNLIFQQGFFSITRTCPHCQGTGRIIKDPCPKCRGNGVEVVERHLKVNLPAGVDTGSTIRLRGEGEPGKLGGPPGDLHIILMVEGHPIFQRQGTELITEVPIPFHLAALGGELEVPTLGEPARLKIPPGTQTGNIFSLKGKGMPSLDGPRGDLHIQVFVEVPEKMGNREKDLMEKIAEAEKPGDYPAQDAFWEKVKNSRRHKKDQSEAK